jgi:hypothetical protein
MHNPSSGAPPSLRAHKRQFAWQILLPLLAVLALILAAGVLVTASSNPASRTWADVSTIWLIAPMLLLALVVVILLGFMIYAIARLHQVTPTYTGRIQAFFALLSGKTRNLADGSVRPVIWSGQAGAILRSIFKL